MYKKILLIGALNKGKIPTGGQEAKNQILAEFLILKHKISVIDTKNWKSRPFVWLKICLSAFKNFDVIILSLSSISAFWLIRYFYLTNKLNRSIYFVVGGWFPKMLAADKDKVKYYKRLRKILVQSNKMVSTLNDLGLDNVSYFPNYKKFNQSTFEEKQSESAVSKYNRFLYLSRIDEDKGASMVIEAFKAFTPDQIEKWNIEVHFYGAIKDNFKIIFLNEIKCLSFVKYCGIIDMRNQENYNLLNDMNYKAFLFCSTYYGEGFPGAILDAMIMGIPVIATDWNYNAEFIRNNIDGLIIPPNDISALTNAIKFIIQNPTKANEMSNNIRTKSKEFSVEKVLGQFQTLYLE